MYQHDQAPQKRRKSDSEVDAIEARLQFGDKRMDAIEASVKGIKDDVSEVLDIVRLGKSFFRLAGHFGAFVKWTTAIGAPFIAFYIAWKGGKS